MTSFGRDTIEDREINLFLEECCFLFAACREKKHGRRNDQDVARFCFEPKILKLSKFCKFVKKIPLYSRNVKREAHYLISRELRKGLYKGLFDPPLLRC